MKTDLDQLLTQLDPVESSSLSAPVGQAASSTDLSALTDGTLVGTIPAVSRAPRRVLGTPHRPGAAGPPLSLASTNDDLLPSVTRRRFLRRH